MPRIITDPFYKSHAISTKPENRIGCALDGLKLLERTMDNAISSNNENLRMLTYEVNLPPECADNKTFTDTQAYIIKYLGRHNTDAKYVASRSKNQDESHKYKVALFYNSQDSRNDEILEKATQILTRKMGYDKLIRDDIVLSQGNKQLEEPIDGLNSYEKAFYLASEVVQAEIPQHPVRRTLFASQI